MGSGAEKVLTTLYYYNILVLMKKLSLERTNIPLYVKLEQIIKSKIMTGEFLPGEQIPTEKDLAGTYQVSSITARQAVLNLVQEGLLLRKQGKGTFVRDDRTTAIKNIMTLNVRGDIDDVVPEGLALQKVNVLDMGRMACPKKIASALNLAEGGEILRIRRTRCDDAGAVLSYVKNYLPVHIGEKIQKKDLLAYSMLHVLRNKVGLPLKSVVQYVMAVIADYEIASALSISISSPVLYLETIIFEEGEKPTEYVQTFYRSDQFKYTLKFDLDAMKTM
jgi:GntR family transcriptional regulator